MLRVHTVQSSQEINEKLVAAEQADHSNTESPLSQAGDIWNYGIPLIFILPIKFPVVAPFCSFVLVIPPLESCRG